MWPTYFDIVCRLLRNSEWTRQLEPLVSSLPSKRCDQPTFTGGCRLFFQTLNELANQGAPLSSLPQKDVTNLLLHSFDTVSYVTLNELANWGSPFEQSPSKRCDQPTLTLVAVSYVTLNVLANWSLFEQSRTQKDVTNLLLHSCRLLRNSEWTRQLEPLWAVIPQKDVTNLLLHSLHVSYVDCWMNIVQLEQILSSLPQKDVTNLLWHSCRLLRNSECTRQLEPLWAVSLKKMWPTYFYIVYFHIFLTRAPRQSKHTFRLSQAWHRPEMGEKIHKHPANLQNIERPTWGSKDVTNLLWHSCRLLRISEWTRQLDPLWAQTALSMYKEQILCFLMEKVDILGTAL